MLVVRLAIRIGEPCACCGIRSISLEHASKSFGSQLGNSVIISFSCLQSCKIACLEVEPIVAIRQEKGALHATGV